MVSVTIPRPTGRTADRIRQLIVDVREAVGEQMFDTAPASVGSIAELLAVVPVGLCLELNEVWTAAGPDRPDLSYEDRLVVELVLGLYNWGAFEPCPN
jgi:hypothetical protein